MKKVEEDIDRQVQSKYVSIPKEQHQVWLKDRESAGENAKEFVKEKRHSRYKSKNGSNLWLS